MNFRYLAYTQDRKIAKGIQAADNMAVATRILAGSGLKILSIKPEASFMGDGKRLSRFGGKVSNSNLVTFSRQFALLHESGTDIVTTLELLKKHMSSTALRVVIDKIMADVNKGSSLSDAMSKHPQVFSRIYVQSVKVGEQSGNLESVLRQMADFLERESKSSQKIKNALRYPALVLGAAVIVIVVLIIYVLPAFSNMYSSLNIKLPATTQALLSIAGWVSSYGLIVIAIIAVICLAAYLWSRTDEGRKKRDELILKIPMLGRVAHLNELNRCCRNMALLYKAGLQVPDILLMVIESSNNLVVKQGLTKVYRSVVKGEGLSRPMSEDPVFLPMMVQMVGVGETTGNLDKTLTATADTYETEADERMGAFIAFLQPAITMIIGLVVAFVAISLVSAMYSMYGQIK